MAVRVCSYDVLTEEQKRILRRFYDEGMTSVERNKHDMIRKAADEIGISFEKVKVSKKWVAWSSRLYCMRLIKYTFKFTISKWLTCNAANSIFSDEYFIDSIVKT